MDLESTRIATERPILFNAFSVRAILANQKCETRRVIKNILSIEPGDPQSAYPWLVNKGTPTEDRMKCKYGVPGDILWVREDFGLIWPAIVTDGLIYVGECAEGRPIHDDECNIIYRADDPDFVWIDESGEPHSLWKPSIFMPKDRCRIWLDVLEIRAERLQDITLKGIMAEGITRDKRNGLWKGIEERGAHNSIRKAFIALWNSINEAKGFGWDKDPLVWVIRFKRKQGWHAIA